MDLLRKAEKYDNQKFQWGEISWLHEPLDSPYKRLSVAHVKIYSGCRQERHFHLGEEQLFYVLQGQGSFIIDGKPEHIHESMVLYSPPYTEHEVLNIGKDDLILLIAYVPIKLVQLEKPYIATVDRNIQELIPIEILKNLKEQLSELLKLTIHVYDRNHKLLTSEDENKDFCIACSSVKRCDKRKYASDVTSQLFEKLYKCDYDLVELEVPIILNENILGYIKSGSFILKSSMEIEKKISELALNTGMELNKLWSTYKQIPNIIKSRIYVMEESLVIAAQFLQEMLERSIFENELIEKDNEILTSTKEKIQLKDALKRANAKIYNEKIFSGSSGITKEINYPYDLEIILEEAIKELDRLRIEESINNYSNQFNDSKSIVKEMIIVLSRTALRKLENIEVISRMRKKYDKYLYNEIKENYWEVLKSFCMECIDEYESIILNNSRELIDRIKSYINQHYREDLNLNQIADVFYISPNYLSSIFNEKNHSSFTEYVQRLRIEEAKAYLISTNLKVNDIGKKVGCKNISYFVNIFKKNVGMTPNEYRKRQTSQNED